MSSVLTPHWFQTCLWPVDAPIPAYAVQRESFCVLVENKDDAISFKVSDTHGYLRAVSEDVLSCERSISMPGMPTCFIVPTVVQCYSCVNKTSLSGYLPHSPFGRWKFAVGAFCVLLRFRGTLTASTNPALCCCVCLMYIELLSLLWNGVNIYIYI